MFFKYFSLTVVIGVLCFIVLSGPGGINILKGKLPFTFPSLSSYVSNIFVFKTRAPVNLEPDGLRLFSAEELSKYDGGHGLHELYIGIFGKVYDVTKGSKHYGQGGSYHVFAGRDASRAFITGDFTDEGLTDDISDFSNEQLIGLRDWVKVYDENYIYIGKLVGRFYDAKGNPTPFLLEKEKYLRNAEKEEDTSSKDKQRFPPCNAEWTPEKGSRLWCSKKSGGIVRDWAGVPRKYYQPGKAKPRCACINIAAKKQPDKEGSFQLYKDCDFHSDTCYVKED